MKEIKRNLAGNTSKDVWLEVTDHRTILVRRQDRVPFEIPGKLSLQDLLSLCDQLANIKTPVRAIPVDSDDKGPASGMPPRWQGIPEGPGRH
jgi:hypothetical protein